jgi:tRNA(Ile2) C34 agmatinyltransferase TiaS
LHTIIVSISRETNDEARKALKSYSKNPIVLARQEYPETNSDNNAVIRNISKLCNIEAMERVLNKIGKSFWRLENGLS